MIHSKMKVLGVLLITFLSFSCKKSETSGIKDTLTMQPVDVKVDGVNVPGFEMFRKVLYDKINGYCDLTALNSRKQDLLTFSFRGVEVRLGKRSIWNYKNSLGHNTSQDSCRGFFSVSEGDQVNNFYDVVDVANNFIEVESYNQQTKLMTGTFQVTFFRNNPARNFPSPGLGDTLTISSDHFELIIEDMH